MTNTASALAIYEEQDCITCFMHFWVPQGFTARRREDKREFYCPNGHSMTYTESEADRLRMALQKAEQAATAAKAEAAREARWRQQERDEHQHTRNRLAAQKGVTTRLKNRVANGVCPCCNRTFMNLQRHMATRHKGFVAEEVQGEVGQTAH